MAGFLKKLFSKESDTPYVMEYADIGVFLDKSEKEDADKVEEFSNLSKPEVMAAIGDLKNKADALSGVQISDDAELSPRVRTVVEKSLPGFSASLVKALPDSLPSDPEEYYKALVEIVQSVGKCLSGQGKYIHVVFPAEMKDIKTSLGVIGREINALNEKIKPAMQNKAKISAVRTALNRSESLYSEYISSLDEVQKIESLISSNEKELISIDEKISICRKSPDFMEYEGCLNRISALKEEKRELKDSYHLAVATVSNVFRKIIYASEKEGNTEFSKSLFSFDDLLLSRGKKDAVGIKDKYSSLYPDIKIYLDNNPGFVKNKSEEHFLSCSDFLGEHLSEICMKYSKVSADIEDLNRLVSSSVSAGKLSDFENRREEIKKENAYKSSRILSLQERQKIISEELPKSKDCLTSTLSDFKVRETAIDNFPSLK